MTQSLEITRGTTCPYSLSLKDEETGKPYEVEGDQALVFGIKRHKLDTDRVLVKRLNTLGGGEYYLELTPMDTADLEPGKYYYDVGLQIGNTKFYNVIKTSAITILPGVTKLGDGA